MRIEVLLLNLHNISLTGIPLMLSININKPQEQQLRTSERLTCLKLHNNQIIKEEPFECNEVSN